MPIFYALVARGSIVLTEHTPRTGNFNTVTRVLLGKINASADAKMSYIYDDYVFHYMVEDGMTYLCLADEQQKRRIPFLFLVDVKEKFVAAYGTRARTAIAYAMPEFARTLADRMVRRLVAVPRQRQARQRRARSGGVARDALRCCAERCAIADCRAHAYACARSACAARARHSGMRGCLGVAELCVLARHAAAAAARGHSVLRPSFSHLPPSADVL